MCKAGSSELLCVGCKSEFSRTGLASLKHCLSRWQLPPQILTHTLFPKRSAKKNTFYGLGKIWVLTDKQVRTGACSSTCVHTPHVTWLQLTAASSLLSFLQHSAVSQLLISCNISIILRRDVRKKKSKREACLLWVPKNTASPDFYKLSQSRKPTVSDGKLYIRDSFPCDRAT